MKALGDLKWLVLGITVIVFVIIGWLWNASQRQDAQALYRKARLALVSGDYETARALASQIPEDDSLWSPAQVIAGEALMRQELLEAAIPYFQSVPRDASPDSLKAALGLAEIYRSTGHLAKSENEFRYILEHQPDNAAVHSRLAYLHVMTAQFWESRPHFLFLIESGKFSLESLAVFGDLERPMEQQGYLLHCVRESPDDHLARAGLAAYAYYVDGDAATAQALLQRVVSANPQFTGAQAILGELLVNQPGGAFADWYRKLPAESRTHPHVWYVRGLWARRQNKLEVAARCFWETLRQVPTHRSATYQLGQVLSQLGEMEGQDFLERANDLFQLTQALDQALRSKGRSEDALKRVAGLMEKTGRFLEASAWVQLASQSFPAADWPRKAFARLSRKTTAGLPRTMDAFNLAKRYDLSRFPAADPDLDQAIGGLPQSGQTAGSSIRFEQPEGVGLNFIYQNGDDPATKGARMFEQTGGGVAVLDLDGDCWPDLYFTQGGKWPHGALEPLKSEHSSDRVFRNLDGKRFIDVTGGSGLGNRGFGQGVSAGDFDGDGFTDLYVANVGGNQLYQNNGDGTFSNVTEQAGLNLRDWTTSCVIVDLNQDGLPDLFDVNYVSGPDVYSAICNGKACSPKNFSGVKDRLHINLGDGRFEWAEAATPDSSDEAKGLGIVAFDIRKQGRPDLFIANDQVANFLLRNSPAENEANVRLENQGFLSGLAFNMHGLAMACMGIAADDANGDGRLDLFVTNFRDESNTLYLQNAAGLFQDATNLSGLTVPSLPYVGWGTQFLDADSDGAPDLVVTNGHVDDYRDEGGEYQMPAQFFRNLGNGRFVEIPAKGLGPYFEAKHLGRGLARLDWNRDGRMDFAVSQIMEPAALVTNATEAPGQFLAVRLNATTTARDAIGSVVEVQSASQKKWTKQLVAGDGFQASNERLLMFGLGNEGAVATVKVAWPSGAVSQVRDLSAGGTLQLVEGTVGIYSRESEHQVLTVEHQAAEQRN